MIIHTTDTGVTYKVEISQEEIDRRMTELIHKLYPTCLEQQASARGAEDSLDVVGTSLADHPQPRPRVQEGT